MIRYLVSCLFFLLLSKTVAANPYISFDMNLGILMSDSDFNNGSSAFSPGVALGLNRGRLNPEIFYKRFNFTREDQIETVGNVRSEIRAHALGLGARLNHTPFMYSKFGWSFHFVKAEYQNLDDPSIRYDSTIDKTWSSPFLGAGFNLPLGQTELFSDIGFYLSGAEYSVFDWEFGLRYFFR